MSITSIIELYSNAIGLGCFNSKMLDAINIYTYITLIPYCQEIFYWSVCSVLRVQTAGASVTLNLFQGPDPARWIQHDAIPAELNSLLLKPIELSQNEHRIAG
jgi:hypothetical protein